MAAAGPICLDDDGEQFDADVFDENTLILNLDIPAIERHFFPCRIPAFDNGEIMFFYEDPTYETRENAVLYSHDEKEAALNTRPTEETGELPREDIGDVETRRFSVEGFPWSTWWPPQFEASDEGGASPTSSPLASKLIHRARSGRFTPLPCIDSRILDDILAMRFMRLPSNVLSSPDHSAREQQESKTASIILGDEGIEDESCNIAGGNTSAVERMMSARECVTEKSKKKKKNLKRTRKLETASPPLSAKQRRLEFVPLERQEATEKEPKKQVSDGKNAQELNTEGSDLSSEDDDKVGKLRSSYFRDKKVPSASDRSPQENSMKLRSRKDLKAPRSFWRDPIRKVRDSDSVSEENEPNDNSCSSDVITLDE